MDMIAGIAAWIVGALIVGLFGRNRQGGFWAFFVGSLLLSFAIGMVVLAVLELIDLYKEKNKAKAA